MSQMECRFLRRVSSVIVISGYTSQQNEHLITRIVVLFVGSWCSNEGGVVHYGTCARFQMS